MAFPDKTKKKKKSIMSPLSEKMGLDMSTEMSAPPRPAEAVDSLGQSPAGLLGSSPEASLNQTQAVSGRVKDKLNKRKKGAFNVRA